MFYVNAGRGDRGISSTGCESESPCGHTVTVYLPPAAAAPRPGRLLMNLCFISIGET